MTYWPFKYLGAFYIAKAKAIGTLYSFGDLSVGAHDPAGLQSRLGYPYSLISAEMRQFKKDVKCLLKELYQDTRRGDWRQALRDRPETNLRQYARIKERADRGAVFERMMLPFHRFVLSIDKYETERVLQDSGTGNGSES